MKKRASCICDYFAGWWCTFRDMTSAPDWKSTAITLFKTLMKERGLEPSVQALDCKIRELAEEYAQLELSEAIAWMSLLLHQDHDNPSLVSFFAEIQTKRENKHWFQASQCMQPGWGPDDLPKECKDDCTKVWIELHHKKYDRKDYENLRSFHQDLDSSMNLDNCFDMGHWTLVAGGDVGATVSKTSCGVFKAKGLLDLNNYAVKCVSSKDRDINTMKREVESHSVLFHPCVLVYAGDYSISSTHFLKITCKDTPPTTLKEFSRKYSESRREFLFIVTEFCEGGSIIRYVHGALAADSSNTVQEATSAEARKLQDYADGTELFCSPHSHHLYAEDYVIMFPPGCDNVTVLPYLANVSSVSECPDDCSQPQQFCIRRVPASQSFAGEYFRGLHLQNFPNGSSERYYFHYVVITWNPDGTICQRESGRTLPRPGFSFLRNFCFRVMDALKECFRCSIFHGDVRLENVFLRNVVELHDVLHGDSDSVGVQLGDFDLATSAKDRCEEFCRDRRQLVVALLVLADSSTYRKYKGPPPPPPPPSTVLLVMQAADIYRHNLRATSPPLEEIVTSKEFCRHLPAEGRQQFAAVLRDLWKCHEPSKTPFQIVAEILDNHSAAFFSGVPVDIKSLHTHYLGPHVVVGEKETTLNYAREIVSCIRSTGFTPVNFKNAASAVAFTDDPPHLYEPLAWSFCEVELNKIETAIRSLCTTRDDCPLREQLRQSKGFLHDDKLLMLVDPDKCRVFLLLGLCNALGDAVKNLIATREHLKARRLEIESEFKLEYDAARGMQKPDEFIEALRSLGIPGSDAHIMHAMKQCRGNVDAAADLLLSGQLNETIPLTRSESDKIHREISGLVRDNLQAMEKCFHEKNNCLSGLLERIDVIESLVLLVMEQCAVHRKRQSMMFFSCNDTLLCFLSAQVETPNPKAGLAGLALLVQLFAYSHPGDQLGKCRPIFDSQTKLETLITHELYGKVQQSGTIVLRRIFDLIFGIIDDMSSHEQKGDITEKIFFDALCALVNILRSYRWCFENSVNPNPYINAHPCCSNCELNRLTSELFCKLQSLGRKKVVKMLQWRENIGALMSSLVSDWSFCRAQRPALCACSCDNDVAQNVFQSVKKIVAYLKLDDVFNTNPELKRIFSALPPCSFTSSPSGSPFLKPTAKILIKVPADECPSPHELLTALSPQANSAVKEVPYRWSHKHISPPQSERMTETTKSSRRCQDVLGKMRSLQCGRGNAGGDDQNEIDLTGFDDESDLERIMGAASADVYQDCHIHVFLFVMYKGERRKEDPKTRFCSEFLAQAFTAKLVDKAAAPYAADYDAKRKWGLLRVRPNRKMNRLVPDSVDGSQFWVAVDIHNNVIGSISIPMDVKSPFKACRRAACKLLHRSDLMFTESITVQTHPNKDFFCCTFSVSELQGYLRYKKANRNQDDRDRDDTDADHW